MQIAAKNVLLLPIDVHAYVVLLWEKAITPLIQQLREEIYSEPYKNIKWSKMRHVCAKADNYYPHGSVQRLL